MKRIALSLFLEIKRVILVFKKIVIHIVNKKLFKYSSHNSSFSKEKHNIYSNKRIEFTFFQVHKNLEIYL